MGLADKLPLFGSLFKNDKLIGVLFVAQITFLIPHIPEGFHFLTGLTS